MIRLKHLLLLPNKSFVFTDTPTYVLPDGCHHSPLATCTFNKDDKVEAGGLFILSKRNTLCEMADSLCAEFNYREWFSHLPTLEQEFLNHYAELYGARFMQSLQDISWNLCYMSGCDDCSRCTLAIT